MNSAGFLSQPGKWAKIMPTERQMAEKLLTSKKVDKLLTMGIYQYYKWDAIREAEKAKQSEVTDAEFRRYSDDLSDERWKDFLDAADRTLIEYKRDDTKWL